MFRLHVLCRAPLLSEVASARRGLIATFPEFSLVLKFFCSPTPKTLRVPPFWMRAGLLIYIMFFKTLARAVDWIFSLRFYRRPLLCIGVNSQWKFVYSIHLIYDMCLLISELRCVFLEVSKWPNSKKISFPLSQISAVLVQLQDYLLLPFVISFERFLWR